MAMIAAGMSRCRLKWFVYFFCGGRRTVWVKVQVGDVLFELLESPREKVEPV